MIALAGLVASCVQMLIYALVPSKAAAFIGVVVGCVAMVTFPAISSIKANNVAEHEQGTIQVSVALLLPSLTAHRRVYVSHGMLATLAQ